MKHSRKGILVHNPKRPKAIIIRVLGKILIDISPKKILTFHTYTIPSGFFCIQYFRLNDPQWSKLFEQKTTLWFDSKATESWKIVLVNCITNKVSLKAIGYFLVFASITSPEKVKVILTQFQKLIEIVDIQNKNTTIQALMHRPQKDKNT